ncbi:hypothetical protein Glove_151g58 [Diversispora epigaea]|uniref:Protein kinase domain-containing protein n=1 Tax=Diversispora epigaea TaxID=1348612 RepID=A0A397IZD8_9GLOM|nr:hypothetical protein Glove_151g58 [Diversispora epigaea]
MASDKTCPECSQTYIDVWSWCKPCNSKHFQNNFDKWTSGNNTIDKFIQDAQMNPDYYWKVIEWIPYDRFKDIKEIAKGGFGTIFKAKWIDGSIWRWDIENKRWLRNGQRRVVLKKFDDNFANLNEDFLNEIAIHLKARKAGSLQFYGITQDPETHKYIMVLQYMNGGNLREYLKNNFNNINWELKLGYLSQLTSNFENIHKLDIIHHDFHPGNILSVNFENIYLNISDFGLSKLIGQDAKNREKKQIFGVLPYIAPEVFGGEEYTKAADVYSFGIIAYEIVTGFAPYYDIPHDRELARKICNGLRPKIPFHIPKLITSLIMRCWDARIAQRPTFEELNEELQKYYKDYKENKHEKTNEITIQIENSEKVSKNKILINSTTPTPMNYITHPEAIYTSRLLDYSSLPKPKNDENFEKELEELTKSTSALSIVASGPAPLCEPSEECAIQLHHYTLQDEMDKGIFYLFRNKKSNPKELFEALRSKIENNNKNNCPKHSVGHDLIDPKLTRQIQEFQWIYPRDKCSKRETCDVKHLYEELKIPAEERIQLLREIMRAIIQKVIEELVDLWDKCLIPQYKRVEFFESLQKIEYADEVYELLSQEGSCLQELYLLFIIYYLLIVESADEVYELLSQEVSRLQELYVKCAANGCWKDVP